MPDPIAEMCVVLGRRALFRLAACAVMAASSGCGGLLRNDNAEGVKFYQQGNYYGAVNHFQQALAKQPGNPDCFYNLGATYHQQAKLFGRPADMQTAEQYYHLCLARNPDHAACQRALAVLLVEENRSDEAAAQLQAWAQRNPMNPDPQIELARLCHESGDLRMAENHLIDAVAIDPTNPRALVALGQLRESTGDPSQALANYSQALAIDPRQPAVSAKVASLNATLSQQRLAAVSVTPVSYPAPQMLQASAPPSSASGTVAR